jgi:hypothetical protein
MKKLLIIGAFGASMLSLMAFKEIEQASNEKTADAECKYGQCVKIKSDGYRCRNCAQQNSYYCWSHR